VDRGAMIEVVWMDSFGGCGWFEDFDGLSSKEIRTVGYFIFKDDIDLRLCRGISGDGQMEGPFVIPLPAVDSITELHY